MSVEDSGGVRGVLINNAILLFLLFAMYACAVFMFQLDRNTGVELLERTTVRGRREQMTAKIAAMGIIALVLLIIFTTLNVGIYGVQYGFGNLMRPIQSVKGFLGCPFEKSVLGYFVMSMVTRWLALFLVGLIFAVICLKTRKAGLSLFAASAIVGGWQDASMPSAMRLCLYILNI